MLVVSFEMSDGDVELAGNCLRQRCLVEPCDKRLDSRQFFDVLPLQLNAQGEKDAGEDSQPTHAIALADPRLDELWQVCGFFRRFWSACFHVGVWLADFFLERGIRPRTVIRADA